MLKKVFAWILLVIAVLGLVLCIGGIVGTIYVRGEVDSIANDLLTVAGGYLQNANSALSDVDSVLSSAESRLTQIGEETAQAAAEGRNPVVDKLNALVGDEAITRLQSLGQVVESLGKSMTSLNETLVTLNRLPNVDVPTFTDEIAGLTARAGEIQVRLQSVRDSIEAADGQRISEMTGDLNGYLEETRGVFSESAQRVQASQQAVGTLNEKIPGYTLWATVGIGLFLLLMAAGQVSLISDCWRWARA